MQLQVEGLSCRVGGLALFERWSCQVGPGITLVQGGEGRGKGGAVNGAADGARRSVAGGQKKKRVGGNALRKGR